MKKFMRTRAAAPPAPDPPPPRPLSNGLPKTNGHANGGARRDDHHSTLSRYWSGSGSGAGAGEALWEDPEFPASARSVGERRLAAGLVWRRPHELSARPTFLAEEAAGEEVEVGALGSAALCSAAAALALTPRLLARVAPPHSFQAPYDGVCRFRFWVFGVWREVAVDDRLPCRGTPPRLLASRARPHDYLLPLLEKAYAKLYGSYAAMRAQGAEAEGGARALQELTGGIVQSFSLARQPPSLTLQVLHSAAPRSTIMVAVPAGEKESGWRRRSPARACCACVTGLARVRGGAGGAGDSTLVRVRARGGAGWRGAWARGGAEWRALPDADRDLLDARQLHPDEFWMSFAEFAGAFSRLELVHVGPDDWLREPALRARRPWRAVLARRRWRRGYNAGGPPTAVETTGTNPQFHVQIPRAAGAESCHVVVSVTQQYCVRAPRRLRAVGFALYELPAGAAPRPSARPLRGLRALDVTHCSRAREVATFFTLPPGEYLLVPHTRRAHTEAAFLLRVLTDQHANIWEVNEDNMIIRSISSEFLDERQPLPPEMRTMLVKLFGKEEVEEVDASALRAALRRAGGGRASRSLCRALVALRDARVCGRCVARDVPPLLRVLALWRAAFAAHAGAGACRPAPAHRLRPLLRAAGVSVSNKVRSVPRRAASRSLCRALVALRDARVCGRCVARDVPPLLRVLALWRAAFAAHAGAGACRPAPAHRLRPLLRAAGVSVSNKVRSVPRRAASRSLCRALVALRDARVCGRCVARDVPPLLRVLALWRAAFAAHAGAGACRPAPAHRLRPLLRAAGVSVSNKVLEGCVARFAPRAALTADAFLLALARLHLAHERYRSLDTKLKSNPLSLEEMILMTIYS